MLAISSSLLCVPSLLSFHTLPVLLIFSSNVPSSLEFQGNLRANHSSLLRDFLFLYLDQSPPANDNFSSWLIPFLSTSTPVAHGMISKLMWMVFWQHQSRVSHTAAEGSTGRRHSFSGSRKYRIAPFTLTPQALHWRPIPLALPDLSVWTSPLAAFSSTTSGVYNVL